MAGKRRIASNAPRTPLSRRSEKETEELAVTPRQELAKMGLCKEDLFMCSQPADSQIDVRWDCNSPEALLQFKRYRGQFLRSEVADIVKKLADETEDGPSTTEPLLGLWMSSKDDTGQTKPFKNNIQRRSDRRRRIRKHPSLASDQCADELLEKLTMALHRHEAALK
ncbi:uncharacterized protein LOC135468209 isoform X2 [Liolophura sinensis]|uniref:uncharacterized protein LOC135468209 isoform X2 n=1 Tax=Liolophura sinensis TaxID=3198878 RepID=UPI00315969BA